MSLLLVDNGLNSNNNNNDDDVDSTTLGVIIDARVGTFYSSSITFL